jgi:hypothetical protein
MPRAYERVFIWFMDNGTVKLKPEILSKLYQYDDSTMKTYNNKTRGM